MQIIPEKRRPSVSQQFGQAFANVGQAAGQMVPEYLKSQAQDEALAKRGIDLKGISDPQIRQQIVADELKYGRARKLAAAEARYAQGKPGMVRDSVSLQENMPGEDVDVTESVTRIGSGEPGGGKIPQPSTRGVAKPVMSGDEIMAEAQERVAAFGGMTDLQTEYNKVATRNQANAQYNQQLKDDIDAQTKKQEKYAGIANEKLSKLFPDSPDDVKALFSRYGEEAARSNLSEAAIEKDLAKKAIEFKNSYANIKKSIGAPTVVNKLKGLVTGVDVPSVKARGDLRVKLNPLLKEGLFDSARTLLDELGFGPEATEMVMFDLGENAQKTVAQLPEMKRPFERVKGPFAQDRILPFNPEQSAQITENIQQAFKSDPSANMILLRKAYEDKGVDWETFRDNVNSMIAQGQIQLNDEQFKALDKINYPPLDKLDKLLEGLSLRTR
jgi:hypothetical protein